MNRIPFWLRHWLALAYVVAGGLAGWAAESPGAPTAEQRSNAVTAITPTAPVTAATNNAPVTAVTNSVPTASASTNTATATATGTADATVPIPPVTVVAAPNSAERNIRFQFDGLPYADVLTRFAQMANKPLISDSKVEGTLSFNDPQPYAYAEALETINLMLSMKGVMLVESDRYLRLVALKELPQMPLRLFRGLDRTGDTRPGEVVTVVLALQNLDSGEIAQAVTAMLSNAGSIAPLSRGKGLIITDRLANIQRIRNLLTEVDTASPIQRQMKTYTLLNASGAVLTDLINRTFGIATAPKRVEFNQQTKQYHQLPADVNDYITAIFDEASRTLVLFGPADRVNLAEELIKRFESKSGVQAGEVRIFYPQSTSALELARMIRQATAGVAAEGEAPAATPTKARLIVDAPTNRLIVTAPAASQLEEIEKLVKKIDVPAETNTASARFQEVQTTKIIRCRTADPESVVRILNDTMATSGPRRRTERTLRVTLDSKTKSIVLIGTPGEVAQAMELVQQLDSDQMVQRVVRIVALKSGRSTDLSSKLRQLYQDQARSLPDAGAPEPLTLPDENGNRLILTGTEAQVKLLEGLIAQLDTPSDSGGRQLKTLKLKYNSAYAAASMLGQMFARQFRLEDPNLRVTAIPGSDDKTLMVEATAATMARIEDMLKTLDVEPAKGKVEVRTYKLTGANAAELAQTLGRLMVDREDYWRRRNSESDPQPRFEADVSSNTLMVAALSEQFEKIEPLIKDITSGAAGTARQLKAIKLRYTSANSIAAMLGQMFARQFRIPDPNQRVVATPSADDKTLMIEATATTMARIEDMLKTLDVESAKGKVEVRTYKLTGANAGELAQTLGRLLADREDYWRRRNSDSDPQPRFEADASSNTLMVAALSEQFEKIEPLIKDVTTGAAGTTRQLKGIKLQYTSANSIAAMLGQMFARQFRIADPNQRVVATPSSDDKTLMVEATTLTMARIEEMVRTLDVEPAKAAFEVRTYHLTEGTAGDLSQTLDRLFNNRQDYNYWRRRETEQVMEPRFEADYTSNTLMVAAPKSQFERIEQLIKELKSSAAVAMEIRTFKLKYSEPDQMVQILETMLRDDGGAARRFRGYYGGYYGGNRSQGSSDKLKITTAPALNAVVIQGPPDKLLLAEQLINTLDKSQTEGASTIQTVHLKKAQADSIAEAVSRTLQARGSKNQTRRTSITPVTSSNSVLVDGPASEVEEVLRIIQELDRESSGGGIEFHIYKLENGNAQEISRVLGQMLESLTRSQSRFGRASAETPVSLAVDERNNSLIISATADAFKVVEQLLTSLDKAPDRTDRVMNFYTLVNADAYDTSTKLQAMYADRAKDEQVTVEADFFSNAITVVAKRRDMAEIEETLKRLDEAAIDSRLQVRLVALDKIPAEQMARLLQNIYPQMVHGQLKLVDRLPVRSADENVLRSFPAPGSVTNQPARTDEDGATLTTTNQPTATTASPEVVVAIDKTANALILSGPAHELDQIQAIIRELNASSASNDTEFRQYPLQEADPIAVTRTLTELFRQEPVRVEPGGQFRDPNRAGRRQPQGQPPGQPQVIAQAPKFVVVAEPRTRSLIVRAKPTDFALLEPLIKQLDVAGLNAQLSFRLVALEHAAPDKLLPLLTQMANQIHQARPGDNVTITRDPRGGALFVVARTNLLDQVEKMIQELDTPADYAEVEVLLIPLKNSTASQLAAVLQGMVRPGARGEASPEALELQEQVRRLKIQNQRGDTVLLDLTKPIKIMADSVQGAQGGGNRLILTSTSDNLKAMAAVVAMMDTVPLMEGITAKLVHLKHAEAATVSQTLSAIFQQGQRAASGPDNAPRQGRGGRGGLNSPLNVSVDQRSNTLILSGRPETLELAQNLIDQMDQEFATGFTEIRVFRLRYASATRLAPLLQSVFSDRGAMGGSAGLRAQVTRLQTVLGKKPSKTTEQPQARAALVIQGDDNTNILIVAARSDAMPLIEDVINTMDIPAASGMATIRIYPLLHADALTLQRLIESLYRGPNSAQIRREDRPSVTVDERTNALIVSGNDGAFAIVASLIERLDKELPMELREVHIVPLENADAMSVAAALQRILDARLRQKTALGKQEADALRVIVIGDPRTNSLLVGGSKEGLDLVKSLAGELDKAAPALSGQIRLVPLKHATAQTLGAALSTLFSQRYQAARTPEVQRNRPIIIPDPRSNSLLIAANVEDNRALDALLEKLDRQPENAAMSFTVIGLRHSDSARLATMLANVFTARRQSLAASGQPPTPQDLVYVESDPTSNALIVSASAENLEIVKGLIAKVDVEPVAVEGLIQTFTLKQADAQRAATMLRSLIDQGIYRPGMLATGNRRSPRDAIAVTVDQRSNTLIVSASPENLMVVKELIKQLDSQAYADGGNIQLFQLKHARASQLASVLEQFFRSKRASEAASGATERSVPVTVTPDDRTNTLLVTGGRETFAAVERMVSQLDAEQVIAKTSFKVVPLKQATAAKLQATLTQLFLRRPASVRGEPADPITVVADSWANSLIVGASPEDLVMVESLIAQLDSDQTEAGLEVQVMPLVKADARRVAQTVQALYRTGGPGTSSPVTVNVDERLNALVVSAGQGDIKRIAELVKKLDTDQVAQVAEIRIFPLANARAVQLATILTTILNSKPASLTEQSPSRQSLLQFIARTEEGKELLASALKEGILITADPRTNSLIISAPVDYMSLLQQLINRLDTSSPQMAQIKVFSLKNADARQMLTVLNGLFRLQRTGNASANDRTVQYNLVRAGPDGEATIDSEGSSGIVGTAEENALTVTVDLRSNSLLVGGTEHYVALASNIIQTLDSSPAQERKTEVYRLKNSRALEIQGALQNFLKQDLQLISAAVGQQAMAQELLEREVAIVAETNSNTLLISASPRNFTQVKGLIEQLDQPQRQVLIQVLLAEVTLDSGDDLGVEWSYKSKGSPTSTTGTDFGVADALKNFGGFSSAISGNNFNFLFRALQSEGRLQVLSRPQILTADNQEADINIGQKVPTVTDSRVTQYGDSINSFNYQDVGVKLRVTPRISPDGFVKMDVAPTISQLSSSDVQISKGFSVPIINQRSATTTVSVQSGQSILIGGLISTTDDARTKRFPFLGKIPVLGALFRSTSKSSTRVELLILLTPQVLSQGPELARASLDAQTITREQLDRSAIQEQFNHDPLQRQILEPLYPNMKTNSVEIKNGHKPAKKP